MLRQRCFVLYLTTLVVLGLTSCSDETTEATAVATPSPAIIAQTTQTVPSPEPATTEATATPASGVALPTPSAFGYTYQQPDGNRVAIGQGSLPDARPLDVVLSGAPKWVTAVADGQSSIWLVVLEDDRVQAFGVSGRSVEPVEATGTNGTRISDEPVRRINAMPPLLALQAGQPRLVLPPTSRHGPTHPVLLPSGVIAFTFFDRGLVVADQKTLDVTALPDGRILQDENGRLLLLTDPNDSRYVHGVLGDEVEATGITLVETGPEPRIVRHIALPEPWVVEGIAPIWVDWNGDGQREIIITRSSQETGAQIVVFDETGAQVAAGSAIGQGFRWRHQIAVAPFGPNGGRELVDVLTPHIGGVVEFYQWRGEALQIVAQVPGYTSHVIGTRNLDMAAAGDFDGDGRFELLLPNQQRTTLDGIRRTEDGAEVAWTVPVQGRVSTNIGTATLADGRLIVGVGREDGHLRLWLP